VQTDPRVDETNRPVDEPKPVSLPSDSTSGKSSKLQLPAKEQVYRLLPKPTEDHKEK
jgi:hypothetical protein